MRKIGFIIVCFLLFASCDKKSDYVCNVEDPLTELSWMKELSEQLDADCEEFAYHEIVRAVYNKNQVFYVQFICPVCDMVFQADLLNCEGDTVKSYNYDEYEAFTNEVTHREKIYTCTPANLMKKNK